MQFLLLTFFIGSKSRPSSMDIVGLCVPPQTLWDFPLFPISPSLKNCPSSKCAAATNSVCGDFDIFIRQSITLSQIWYSCFCSGPLGCWLSTVTEQCLEITFYMSDLRFSQQCGWRFKSAQMWHCLVGWVVPGVSKDHGAFVFKDQAVWEEQLSWEVCGNVQV